MKEKEVTKVEFYKLMISVTESNGYEPKGVCAFTGKVEAAPQWSLVDELTAWEEIEKLIPNNLTSTETNAIVLL